MFFAEESALPETGLVGRIVGGVTVAGLLAMILYWLLYTYLPSQDEKTAKKDKAQAEHIETMGNRFAETFKYLFEKHREALEVERASSERRHMETMKHLSEGQQAILNVLNQLVKENKGL